MTWKKNFQRNKRKSKKRTSTVTATTTTTTKLNKFIVAQIKKETKKLSNQKCIRKVWHFWFVLVWYHLVWWDVIRRLWCQMKVSFHRFIFTAVSFLSVAPPFYAILFIFMYNYCVFYADHMRIKIFFSRKFGSCIYEEKVNIPATKIRKNWLISSLLLKMVCHSQHTSFIRQVEISNGFKFIFNWWLFSEQYNFINS